jgi:hypothetical protein
MPTPNQTAQAVADAEAALVAANAAHAAAMAEAANPREPMTVIVEIIAHLVSRHGNHPDLEKLLHELEAAVAPQAR